jgi:hypothetical protein
MGFSIRAFLLDKEGEPQLFSRARLERLWRNDPRESLPGYAGTDARFALAYIKTDDGHPSEIAHMDYIRLHMGADGRVDEDAEYRRLALAAGSMDFPSVLPKPDMLIDAEHLFNRRRYQHEFSWRPTAAQKESLARLIKEQWRRRPRPYRAPRP